MVEPQWDFKGGESFEAAIERYKTGAIPEFLDLIVREAKVDNYMVIYPPPSHLHRLIISYVFPN